MPDEPVRTRLRLRAVDAADPLHWRWRLTDEDTGALLAEHRVRLDPRDWETEAFTDLRRHLGWRADPDRRVAEEAALTGRLGAWIARKVLGAAIVDALAEARPVRVRVVGAAFLVGTPLEQAHLEGVPLSRHEDVHLAFVTDGAGTGTAGTDRPLRMLAVFSAPSGTSALALRSERLALTRMVAGLRRPVALEVLHWGVTRAALAERVAAGGGPDVLHLSGHGARGALALEDPDGTVDEVDGDALVALLGAARPRLRLAVLSACESAAASLAETRRLLDLPAADPGRGDAAGPGLAWRLAGELGCSVLAMRYPVTDDYAIALAGEFYTGLIDAGMDVGTALGRAVRAAGGTGVTTARPALSQAAPVLIGSAELALGAAAPEAAADRAAADTGLPPEPERFVGRHRLLAAASTALADRAVVAFTGMAGVGKTSCAVELAHRHRADFQKAVWWRPPETGDALADLAFAVDQPAVADAAVDGLTAALAGGRLLLVLDGIDALLDDDGRWRDPRWERVLTALTSHGGPSRTVLTCRFAPPAPGVVALPVHPLSGDEAALLARQLPGLRRLLHLDDDAPDDSAAADRARARAILNASQGHPLLLELADAAGEARDAEDGTDFLRTGATTLNEDALTTHLARWAGRVLDGLPPDARLMMQLLAAMEEPHRSLALASPIWERLWRRLDRTGEPPDPAGLVAELSAAALVAERDDDHHEIQPAVTAAVRDLTPADIRTAADLLAADVLEGLGVTFAARGDREATAAVVASHLAAVPYLLRQREWSRAAANLDQVLARDHSPRVGRTALALARAIDPGVPERNPLMARALVRTDPAEAERLMRWALESDDKALAAAAAGDLASLLLQQGRTAEALEMTTRYQEHGTGLGRWGQLAAEVRRLQVLHEAGRDREVLDQVGGLLEEARTLPSSGGQREAVAPWAVREALLNMAANAARTLERWRESLDYNGELLNGIQQRGTRELDLARHWFNDHGPLIALGRFAEARKALEYCREVATRYDDVLQLAKVLGAQAYLAAKQRRWAEAAELERAALRAAYREPQARDLATGHQMLGNHLGRLGTDPAGQLAHHLAAALLATCIGSEQLPRHLHVVATDLHTYGEGRLPDDVGRLAARVERVEGVRFTEVLESLLAGASAEDAYRELLAEVRATAAEQGFDVTGNLLRHDSRLPLFASAADGDERARAQVSAMFPADAKPGTLAAALHRLIGGERDSETLTDGLHPADAAVVRRALDELDWRRTVRATDPDAMPELLREGYLAAVDAADHARAGHRATEIAGLLHRQGRPAEALPWIDRAAEHTRRAGFGVWTQRLDLVRRLGVLGDLGRDEEILVAVTRLYDDLRGEADLPTPADPANPTRVRDGLLTAGFHAAVTLERWEHAADFNAALRENAELRGAGPAELAMIEFRGVLPLLRSERPAEAEAALANCGPAIRAAADRHALTLLEQYERALAQARARAEEGTGAQALQDAYTSATGAMSDVLTVIEAHNRLIGDIARARGDMERIGMHSLATALIGRLVGEHSLADIPLHGAARLLYRTDGSHRTVSLDELTDAVEREPGVRFRWLVTELISTPEEAGRALAELHRRALALPVGDVFGLDRHLAEWGPFIDGVIAVASGEPVADPSVLGELDELGRQEVWTPLVAGLRRIAAGDPPTRAEAAAMHPIHATVLNAALDRLPRPPA